MLTQETVSRIKSEIKGQVRFDEPMSLHTSFHIGGPADVLIIPADRKDLRTVLRIAQEEKVPLTVIGNGSNLLVRDKGIRGIVLKLGNALKHWEQIGNTFVFDSGFTWLISVPTAYLLSKFTTIPFVYVFLIVSLLELGKVIIGFILVRSGVWVRNLVNKP